MGELLNNILIGIQNIFSPIGILYIFGGAFIGLVLGALPGLNGGVLTLLLLPVMYKMDPALALGVLIAVHVASEAGGCISSVLLGIPGTASSIATVWDGYEFGKAGDPVRPLSVSAVVNYIVCGIGLIVSAIACATIAKLATRLGPWEYAAMCFTAIAIIIGLSKGNIIKGFVAVGLAILVSSVGMDAVYGTKRLTFGSVYLYDGFNVINIMLGMYGLNLILSEFARRIKADVSKEIKVRKFKWPSKDINDNKGAILRSFIIGLFVGFIPGMGGPTAAPLAYATEKGLSKNKEKWGRGEIRGVIAPEAAHASSIGGALIPMIALGVPGDAVTAMFLVGLTVLGIDTGPMLMRNNPDIVYMIFVAGIIAATFVFLIQVFGMRLFPLLLKIPYQYLYPVILAFMLTSAYQVNNSIYGLFIVLGACILGIIMDICGIPKEPFIMTCILSSVFERNVRLAMNYSPSGAIEFLVRPVSCLFIIIGVCALVWNVAGSEVTARIRIKRSSE